MTSSSAVAAASEMSVLERGTRRVQPAIDAALPGALLEPRVAVADGSSDADNFRRMCGSADAGRRYG